MSGAQPYYSGKGSLTLLNTGEVLAKETLLLAMGILGPKNSDDPLNLFLVPDKRQPEEGYRTYICFQDIDPVKQTNFSKEHMLVTSNGRLEFMLRETAIEKAAALIEWQASICKKPREKAVRVIGKPKMLGYITRALRCAIRPKNLTSIACHQGIEALFQQKPLNPETYRPIIPSSIIPTLIPYDPFNL